MPPSACRRPSSASSTPPARAGLLLCRTMNRWRRSSRCPQSRRSPRALLERRPPPPLLSVRQAGERPRVLFSLRLLVASGFLKPCGVGLLGGLLDLIYRSYRYGANYPLVLIAICEITRV